MTGFDDTDRRIASWFADEGVRAPERTIDVVLAHARAHPRRPDPFTALRRDPMRPRIGSTLFMPVPLLAVIGLLAIAIAAGAIAGGSFDRPAVVVTPSPSPTSTPTPARSPTPVPSPAIIRVDLVEVLGADASVDITDRSGTLASAESGQPADGGSVASGAVDIQPDPSDADVAVLTWTGTPCDTTHTLDIAPDGRTLTLRRASCEGDAIPRDLRLRLRFAGPIDTSTMHGTVVTQ
jgi:hypothetical protein